MASCFANLSQKKKRQVLYSASYYPKTYSLELDYAPLSLDFDSTRTSFLETVKDENFNEKRFIDMGAVKEIIEFLKTDEKLFYDLSMDVVDRIVFQRMGLTVFEIKKKQTSRLVRAEFDY